MELPFALPVRAKKLLPWLVYPAVYIVMFFAFAYLTFPYGRLKQQIVSGYAASQQSSPQPKRMQIGDATWSWRFPGVVLSDVELIGPKPQPAEEGEAPTKRFVVHIDEAYAGVSLLSAVFGTTDVQFDIEGFGGTLSGHFTSSSKKTALTARFDGVDPGQLPGVRDTLQLPLEGALRGDVELSFAEGKYSTAEGTVRVEIEDLKIGDGKTKIRDLLALPTLSAGVLSIEATAENGRVKLEKFAANGPDIEVDAEGRIRLRDSMELSAVEQLNLGFKFTDAYRGKDDTTIALLGKPGSSAPGVLDLDPKVKRAKQPDGSYRWRVSGPFGRLSFLPGSQSPGATNKPASK